MKNLYFPQFGGNQTEQNLVQDLVDEQIKLFGSDCFYLPRKLLLQRPLNDIIMSNFKEAFMVEMMLVNVEGFGGAAAQAMTKFGLKISDEITFIMSRRIWNTVVTPAIDEVLSVRPSEGDLIYYPLTGNLYEIKYVEREAPFYQLGNLYMFTMTCELANPGDFDIDTGVEEIDDVAHHTSYAFPIQMQTGGLGTFDIGETITQTIIVSGQPPKVVHGKVVEWNIPTRKLVVSDVDGDFTPNYAVVGEKSGAQWVINTFETIDIEIKNYDNADNKYYEDTGDTIIDFSEGNPFGEYGNLGDSF
jgi:hypothetical protein